MLTVSQVIGVGFRGAFRRFDDEDDAAAVFVVVVDDNDDSTEGADVVTASACKSQDEEFSRDHRIIKLIFLCFWIIVG